jgi:hypothetical protein
MLEGSGSWQVERLAQLANQLPSVDGIKQVDVTRLAIQNLERKALTGDAQN